MIEERCPICGQKIIVTRYYEEVGLVETDQKCTNCLYHYSDAYGFTVITFDKHYFNYTYSISSERYFLLEKKMNKARWKYRKYLKRINKIKGKQYSKSF